METVTIQLSKSIPVGLHRGKNFMCDYEPALLTIERVEDCFHYFVSLTTEELVGELTQ